MRKKILGAENPSTLISMANLAHIYWSQERHDEAFDLMKLARKMRARAIGENHSDIITTKETLEAWIIFQDNA